MRQQSIDAQNRDIMRLHPLALAMGFGAAAVLGIVLFGTAIGAGMMGGAGGGWMMRGSGYGGGSMMGSGLGLFAYALIWGGIGGAILGGVTASIYNGVVGRNGCAPADVGIPSVLGPDR
jgi:hypothetical protein